MTSEIAIRTQGLGKVFPSPKGPIVAVENLDLSVPAGQIFGLLGPNGAGKTTTIRMLCGLVRPGSGSASVDGLSVAWEPDRVRRRIGLVPEDVGDYKNLTLLEELEYYGAFHGMDARTVRRQAAPLIERLGLGDRTRHRLKTFSRGMRRKFHLIRALLHRPRILLLDEPTAGLDPQATEEVWVLLKALVTEHAATVVLCSHHLEEVERLCDRVAILRRRRLVEGDLAQMRGEGRSYRVRLTGEPGPLVEAVRAVAGVGEVATKDGMLHLTLCEEAGRVMPQVVRRLVESGAEVVEVAREDRDLRSVYRDAIGQSETQPGEVNP